MTFPRSSTFVLALALAAFGGVSSGLAATDTKKVPTETIMIDPKKEKPDTTQTRGATGPQVRYGTEGLPERVRAMRERILEAVRTGDIESLRIAIESNEMPPSFSVNEVRDPIAYLREQSGDGEGREILAILWDILDAGWVHIGKGTAHEMYVWPYFAEVPLGELTPEQLVEMYRIVTSSDYEEMRAAGKWLFYKIGLGPDGTWHFFKTGD